MARKKSIDDLNRQYLRITSYLAKRPTGDHTGMQRRAQKAYNTYVSNIWNTKSAQKLRARESDRDATFESRMNAQNALHERKYSQSTYMGLNKG